MARRTENLLLRGNVWWLRVRVPEAIRPVLGKTEVRRSLQTSDPKEARRRVRIERLKTEADFDEARRKLARRFVPNGVADTAPVDLSETEVWRLATRWFVEAEKRNCERHVVPPDEESLRDAFNELAATEQWDEVSDQVHSAVRKLLAEVGVSDPADQGIAKPWRATLSRAIQEAMVESERRLINRMTGRNSLALNPVFYSFSDLAVSGMTALR